MVMRKCYIQSREFIPEVAEITGMNIIDIEWEFGKAEILGIVCVFDVDITAAQAQEIDRRAKMRREKGGRSSVRIPSSRDPRSE